MSQDYMKFLEMDLSNKSNTVNNNVVQKRFKTPDIHKEIVDSQTIPKFELTIEENSNSIFDSTLFQSSIICLFFIFLCLIFKFKKRIFSFLTSSKIQRLGIVLLILSFVYNIIIINTTPHSFYKHNLLFREILIYVFYIISLLCITKIPLIVFNWIIGNESKNKKILM